MKNSILLILLIFLMTAFQEEPVPYRVFNAKGKEAGYKDLLKAAKESDVIFFGELHDNALCHWLELRLTKDLYEFKKQELMLGMEMFETDNQLLLNEYTGGKIRKKDFEEEAKLWKNYKTDYAPLVDFAAEKKIRVIGTNIPRRFAAMTNLHGFIITDSLQANERGLMAPLPIPYDPELPGYKKMTEGGSEMGPNHSGENLPKAQAMKDATMAYFILKTGTTGKMFLHFNGSYHSDNHEGIVWYVNYWAKKYSTELKILTISSVEQDRMEKLDSANTGLGDFILCFPSDMTKTF